MSSSGRAILLATFLFFSCTRTPVGVPTSTGRSSQELQNPLLAISGIYPDGWMAQSASLQLSQPRGRTMLRIRGTVPLVSNKDFRNTVELRIDDEPMVRRNLALGAFDVSIAIAEGAPIRRVTVAFDHTQALPGADGRQVGARLEAIGFEPQNAAALPAGGDIVRDAQVELGANWGPLETFGGETFRWVQNDGQLIVSLPSAHEAVLNMMLEPGPGAGGRPMLLRILDQSGHQAGAILLDRRKTFQIVLPLAGKASDLFQLHAEGGGAQVPHDSRVLNFRAFSIDGEPWRPTGS